MSKKKEHFNFNSDYKKTAMKSAEGRVMTTESHWNKKATQDGVIRITMGDNRATIRVLDLISNLMVHAGEEPARYMSDGLMAKTKEKKVISYPFTTRLARPHYKGEMLQCELQIEVPEELLEYKGVTRKHIVHEGKVGGIPIIGAPKGAGKLSK